ncbi:serine-type D-Ala-D-Ala carboxypeptidase [Clostridia bacterium]|nr:serine-type D-Ala-D-Ala carboxypeptidase [Clostridia bacterium]
MLPHQYKRYTKPIPVAFALLFSLLLFATNTMAAGPESIPSSPPEIAAKSAILMDVGSQTILYEKNSHEQMYPASITKIMTALLALEHSSMGEEVTFSYNSVHRIEGSHIGRDTDEVLTMEQCLYALLLNSANECAYAIAEHVGGTYEQFVQMMNEKAKDLGCTDTNFTNPHGLPDDAHVTSAYDMALIGAAAIRNATFREITGTFKYTIPPTNKHPDDNTYLEQHHKMMTPGGKYFDPDVIGGKTGYTSVAGNTLVTFAKRNDVTLVCVIMGDKTPDHYVDTKALLDYAFDNIGAWDLSVPSKAQLATLEAKMLSAVSEGGKTGVSALNAGQTAVSGESDKPSSEQTLVSEGVNQKPSKPVPVNVIVILAFVLLAAIGGGGVILWKKGILSKIKSKVLGFVQRISNH